MVKIVFEKFEFSLNCSEKRYDCKSSRKVLRLQKNLDRPRIYKELFRNCLTPTTHENEIFKNLGPFELLSFSYKMSTSEGSNFWTWIVLGTSTVSNHDLVSY